MVFLPEQASVIRLYHDEETQKQLEGVARIEIAERV